MSSKSFLCIFCWSIAGCVSADGAPDSMPVNTQGVTYAENPCASIKLQEGYVCLPNLEGGFVIVPAGSERYFLQLPNIDQ